ncbi:MAG: ABC transporter ATP-binding protein [Clostridia bacterium]|nr:ABC transporter ATP-binding protein [Clostridia bacterium]
MIEVKNVTKKFGDFTAIQDLSFTVGKSSIYGLVGYNGAGKTTLLKTIAGVYKATDGEILVGGENIYENEKMKKNMFFVPDDLYFKPYSTMKKMVQFYKGFYPNFSDDTFKKLTEAFGLDPSKHINGFSKGMQRQAELILGMSTHPQYLLLDESFDGLDPAKRNFSRKLLLEYMAEKETSIIISSHNLHDLADLCDHIGLINGQKIVLDCSVNEMSGSRSKFRVAFDKEMNVEDFKELNFKRITQDGKLFSLTSLGDADEFEEKLRAMSPVLIERFSLSLEEIFLDEMEDGDHDITGIFN